MKLLAVIFSSLLGSAAFAGIETLVVHEWGTFTSLQDEAGHTLGGINSDDEPLPAFAHDIDHLLILKRNAAPQSHSQRDVKRSNEVNRSRRRPRRMARAG